LRRTALLAAILFLVAGAPVHAAGTPLFTAFKQFCLDTRLDMDAMRAALAAAGGRQTISAFPPDFPGQINEFWDLTFTGRPLRVTVSAGLDPGNGHRIQPTINAYCSVNTIMPWADTTSDAALAKWVGIPPTTHDEVVATTTITRMAACIGRCRSSTTTPITP
jgi:hypothetical protein